MWISYKENKEERDLRKSNKEKLEYLRATQKIHEKASWEIVDTVFSLNTGKRDELVNESVRHPITMVDFADIPESVTNAHLLRLIAYILDKTFYEEEKSQSERTNTFLLNNEWENVVVSPELLRIMERKLKNSIDVFLKIRLIKSEDIEDLKKYFDIDWEWNILFKDQTKLLEFLRKTPIKNDETITQYRKTKNILIVCSLLKQIIRHHDFKSQKKNIHQVRELLEKFVRWDLLSMLDWEAKYPANMQPIEDKSHVDFFHDKIFIFRRKLLSEYNINYHKDIHVKIAYRAKQDESIQDKLMIEPTAKTADMLHDLWWLKYVVLWESQKEERIILLYLMFLIYANREQKYNTRVNSFAPSNDDHQAFLPQGKYANNLPIIEKFLNEMTVKGTYDDNAPLFKDKWVMPLNELSIEWSWALDYKLLEKLHITDTRFIHLLKTAVEKKNQDFRKNKEQQARNLDEEKKHIFIENVYRKDYTLDQDICRFLVKKYSELNKKIMKIVVWDINTIPHQSSKFGFGIDKENNIYVYSPSAPDTHYTWDMIKEYMNKWKKVRQDHQNFSSQTTKKWSHKWARQDGKTASNVRVWHKSHEIIPVETQVLWENELKNLPMIDDHVIFNPAKKLLVHWRNNSGVLSLSDIYDIVDKQVLDVLEKNPDKYCENGKTFKELATTIEQDHTLLPAGWSLRDKIFYNFTHNRGLVKKGNIYLTKYYYNLKHYSLTPDMYSL